MSEESSADPSPRGPPPRRGLPAGALLFLGCGAFIVLAVLAVVLLVALNSFTGSLSKGTVLKMRLGGAIPEYARQQGLEELFGPRTVTVRQHVFNLKKAAVDPKVAAVVLVLEPLQVGFAKVEELRDALVEFKKSGKPVYAFSEFLTEKEYALALAADEIIMPTESVFELNGLATDISHYPGLLEKLGVQVQFFRFGKYKSASGEQIGARAFSEPVKEMLQGNLERTYGHFADAVATFRKLDRARVDALVEETGRKANWARENGLIDRLAYWDEVEALLREKVGLGPKDKLKYVSASRYRDVSPAQAGLPTGKHTMALIYSQGLIVAGKGGADPFSGDAAQGSDAIIQALHKAVDDPRIKAIIFRVDSPGGAGLGCDYVRREVERAKAKKPVIVSMSDVAASGGYWVSMDASGIVAQPSTATGSIGIFALVPNLKGLYEKLDLNNETFKKGAHADELIGARPLSAEEAKRFDDDLFQSYRFFVSLAAKGRGASYEDFEPKAQGRTWLGDEAKELGLVDRLGGFDAAVALAKEKAGLPEGDTVSLELFDTQRSPLEQLLRAAEDPDDLEPDALVDALLSRLAERSGVRELVRTAPGLGVLLRRTLSGEPQVLPLMEYHVDYR